MAGTVNGLATVVDFCANLYVFERMVFDRGGDHDSHKKSDRNRNGSSFHFRIPGRHGLSPSVCSPSNLFRTTGERLGCGVDDGLRCDRRPASGIDVFYALLVDDLVGRVYQCRIKLFFLV